MSSAAGRPVEVELKFRVVDLAAAERYLVAEAIGPFSGGAAARATQLEDRYVDTAGGALTRAGFAVRLRQSGRDTIVSVKSLARTEGAGGSVRREELEGPADPATAGPLEWPASDARSLVLELAGDAPLVELVTIRQLRRKRIVRDGDTRVELSLDEVDVVARSRVVDRFVELEAELVKGDEERLAGLAEVFAADPALAPERGSKLEAALAAARAVDGTTDRARSRRGRRRLDAPTGAAEAAIGSAETLAEGAEAPADQPAPPQPTRREIVPSSSDVLDEAAEAAATPDAHLVVGKSPGVTADDHVAEAARKVMRFHLARMLAREAGVRAGTISRTSTRCVSRRAASARPGASSARTSAAGARSATGKGLREIAARLGAVRDLDVLIEAADSLPRGPADRRAAGPGAAPGRLADASRRRPGPPRPRAGLGWLPALGR